MTFRYTEDQEAWLRDLETTDAPQCEGNLHIAGEGFCCLGRACQVLLGDSESVSPRSTVRTWAGRVDELPSFLAERLHMHDEAGNIDLMHLTPEGRGQLVNALNIDEEEISLHRHGLIDLNDDAEWTFKQIAAFIRANPEAVFMKGAE